MEYQPTILLPKTGFIPFEPFLYQELYLKDMSDYRLLNKSRQIGFTTCCAVEIVFYATRGKGEQIVILSKDAEAAAEFHRYVRQILHSVKGKDPDMPDVVKDNLTYTEFADGSRIKSIAASAETGRSISASRLYFDECAFTPYVDSIFQAVEPTLSQTKGKMTVLSTPKGRANLFAKLAKNPVDYDFSYHQYEWWWCPTYNPYYKQWKAAFDLGDFLKCKELIEKARKGDWYVKKRKKHSELSFKQEFECSLDADMDSAFSQKQLDTAFYKTMFNTHFDPDPYHQDAMICEVWWRKDKIEGHSYATGVDLGRKRDATVLATFDITESPAELVEFKYVPGGTSDWSEIILTIRNTYGYFKSDLRADATGVGDAIFEAISDIAEPYIIASNASAKGKMNLIENLRRAMDNRIIRLPKIDVLYAEHEKYTWNDKQISQDCVIATAIAVSVFYDPETEGMYLGADRDYNFIEA